MLDTKVYGSKERTKLKIEMLSPLGPREQRNLRRWLRESEKRANCFWICLLWTHMFKAGIMRALPGCGHILYRKNFHKQWNNNFTTNFYKPPSRLFHSHSVIFIYLTVYSDWGTNKKEEEKEPQRPRDTKCIHIFIMRVLEREKQKGKNNIWRNHGQKLPKFDLKKHESVHPRSSTNSNRVNSKSFIPRNIIVKLLKDKHRES